MSRSPPHHGNKPRQNQSSQPETTDAIEDVREVQRNGEDCLAVEYPSRTYIYLIADRSDRKAVALWEEVDGQAYAVRSKWDFIHAASELEQRFNWTTTLDPKLTQISTHPRKQVVLQ